MLQLRLRACCAPAQPGPPAPRPPAAAGARGALLRSRGWRQGLPVWDRAATCCLQPQPHNGALVSLRPADGGQCLPAHPRLRALLYEAAVLAGQHGAGWAGPTALGHRCRALCPRSGVVPVPEPR